MIQAEPTKTVYGPVPSRRLGRSLGVSPVPRKVCTYSCVYCQLGPTVRLTTERRSFFPKESIAAEIVAALERSEADYVTFAGDGEPTLCADLGWLVHWCKAELKASVAVITNASLFDRPDVRRDLLEADIVLPSLDAGSEAVFRGINRPHPDVDYGRLIEGLKEFRREFRGLLRVEVMLVRNVNDSMSSLHDLRRVVDRVGADNVDIMVPTRPPTERWVEPPSPAIIRAARELIRGARTVTGYEEGAFASAGAADPERAIMGICLRHPLREAQARHIERSMNSSGVVDALIGRGEVSRVMYNGMPYLMPPRCAAQKPGRGQCGAVEQ